MLKKMDKIEISMVAGGDFWSDLRDTVMPNKQSCMGDGRIFPVTCYGEMVENGARGWKASSEECADWFCCSKEKGVKADYFVFKDFDGARNVTCSK